jgi:hypothetical protein
VKHNQISIFRPEEYGTVDPTGALDSSSAFSSCIAAIEAAGGGILFLQPGTFKLSSWTEKTITVPLEIKGCGITLTQLQGAGSNFIKTQGYSLYIHDCYFYAWDEIVNLDGLTSVMFSLVIERIRAYCNEVCSWDSVSTGVLGQVNINNCEFTKYSDTAHYIIHLQGPIDQFSCTKNKFPTWRNRAISIGDGSSAVTTWKHITIEDNYFVTGADIATTVLLTPIWVEGDKIFISNNKAGTIAATQTGVDAAYVVARGNVVAIHDNTYDTISSSSGDVSFIGGTSNEVISNLSLKGSFEYDATTNDNYLWHNADVQHGIIDIHCKCSKDAASSSKFAPAIPLNTATSANARLAVSGVLETFGGAANFYHREAAYKNESGAATLKGSIVTHLAEEGDTDPDITFSTSTKYCGVSLSVDLTYDCAYSYRFTAEVIDTLI